MKFLCDNCKAKYQIADEKVAGKTVRMKCRKCGHQIEVRAAVTETSAAAQPPKPPGAPATPGSAVRPPQRSGLATSLSATKPRAPSPSVAPSSALAGAFKSNVQDAPNSVPETRGGTIELSVTDEWYVAINGVPVGPVRISELRRKAAAGAVTEESLCWQEGLEEWRPIRSIPELATLVREAAQGNRPSLIGTPAPAPVAPAGPPELPARASIPSAPSAPRQPIAPARGTNAPPPRPLAPSAPSVQRSNVVPLRPAASSSIDEMPLGQSSGPGNAAAAAAFAPAPTPAAPPVFTPQPQRLSLPPPTIDPFAVPTGPAAPAMSAPMAPTTPYRESAHPPAPSFHPPAPYMEAPKKQGVPLWFWPILVLALGFGGGVAFLVFRPQPAPAPVVIQMPQATAQPTPTTPVDVPPPTAPPEPAPAETATTKKTGPVAAKGNTAKTPPEEKKGLDLGGLTGGGGSGPNIGPGGAGGSAGGGLDQAGVERVVAGHRAGVKRTCWERGGDQKSSVNVTVTANVAPNGTVSSTSSSGDDPVVAKCIESQVKTWTFPAPGSPTTINIPFKFVRQ